MEWQPIETAPKEEQWSNFGQHYAQRILAYCPDQPDVLRCRWWWSNNGASNFIADGGRDCHPTHWMPLPSPPKEPQ
jgi:hypothetical protein